MTELKNRLYPSEWIVVFVLMGVMTILTLVSHSFESDKVFECETESHEIYSKKIKVTAEGEVEFPGSYEVEKGVKISELLDLAKPKSTAELSKIKMDATLRNNQKIILHPKKMLTIYFKFDDGTLEECKVSKGEKITDLKNKVAFKEELKVSWPKKRLYAKDGETILVTSKKPLNNIKKMKKMEKY